MALGNKTVTKEASSRAVGTTSKRPESVKIKGRDLGNDSRSAKEFALIADSEM